jgi:hypothetical protein
VESFFWIYYDLQEQEQQQQVESFFWIYYDLQEQE